MDKGDIEAFVSRHTNGMEAFMTRLSDENSATRWADGAAAYWRAAENVDSKHRSAV